MSQLDRTGERDISGGICSTCGLFTRKLYGGEGRYMPECFRCWTHGWMQEIAVANEIEQLHEEGAL